MQFLRTLFWVVLAVIAAIFAFKNWTTVTINLWGGLQADAKLPALLGFAFLLGLLPTLLLYWATRWRYRRRLDQAERQRVDAPIAPYATPAAAPDTGVPLSIPPVAP